jgi:hypothetical protein
VGTIVVTGNRAPVRVQVPATKATEKQEQEAKGRFSTLVGPVSIAAADAPRKTRVNGVGWEALPDYGRGESAMSIVTDRNLPESSFGPPTRPLHR